MAIILFDENRPRPISREKKQEIAARVRAGFQPLPGAFVDTVTPPFVITRPYGFCKGCLLPIETGTHCGPCARKQKTENEEIEMKQRSREFFTRLGICAAVGLAMAIMLQYLPL